MKIIFSVLYSAFAAIIIAGCACSNNFKFNLPPAPDWADAKVKFIMAHDTTKLAYRETESSNCKKGIIFIPGSTMYGYYYVPLMNELSKYNIAVRVIDIRGHGDSEGHRGDVPNENSLIDDLSLHIEDMKAKYPRIEILIGGHSMGGGICGRYVEHNGYNSVKGIVYLSPFFHYKQAGMKNPGYVDVSILKVLFGNEHDVTQWYHPSSTDPKLVTQYTNMMSIASMVSDYSSFRKNYTTNTFFIIGKEDELFDWNESIKIFEDKNTTYNLIEKTGHLNFKYDSLDVLGRWINNL